MRGTKESQMNWIPQMKRKPDPREASQHQSLSCPDGIGWILYLDSLFWWSVRAQEVRDRRQGLNRGRNLIEHYIELGFQSGRVNDKQSLPSGKDRIWHDLTLGMRKNKSPLELVITSESLERMGFVTTFMLSVCIEKLQA